MAELYGAETKRVNEAVRNNPDKFPADYMFELDAEESRSLRSKISSLEHGGKGTSFQIQLQGFHGERVVHARDNSEERSGNCATFAIIETFTKVRGLKRELVELHTEDDKRRQTDKMRHFGKTLADLVMPEHDTVETESSLELNFFIGKLKHTVRRLRKTPVDRSSSQ